MQSGSNQNSYDDDSRQPDEDSDLFTSQPVPAKPVFTRLRNVVRCSSIIVLCIITSTAYAQLDGKRTVALLDQAGEETVIGTVEFLATEKQVNFKVDLSAEVFTDHFLSMRPFRCIEGPEDWACHLPYPYDIRQVVTSDDLIDLEYSLLFIAKKPTEFGIDAWNGRYYRLEIKDDDTLEGTLHEVDLNLLASPPEGAFARPLANKHLNETDPDSHRFPRLRIR